MLDIVVCLGVFKVMLYNYFSLKEEMFVEIMSGIVVDEICDVFV